MLAIVAAVVAAVAAVVPAATAWTPAAGADGNWTVAIIGDFGKAGAIEAAVAGVVNGWQPMAVFTLGDNNYESGSNGTADANIGQYYSRYLWPYWGAYGQGNPSRVNAFWPSPGNHDWGNTQPPLSTLRGYREYFYFLPGNGRYYNVSVGPADWFSLDSDTNEPDGVAWNSTQGLWLRDALAASVAPHRVVYMHHPPFSSGAHQNTPYMDWPFELWGATAVIGGHDHDYERLSPPGTTIPYVVNGLGGKDARLWGPAVAAGSVFRYNTGNGAQRVRYDEQQMVFDFVDTKGVLIDTVTALARPRGGGGGGGGSGGMTDNGLTGGEVAGVVVFTVLGAALIVFFAVRWYKRSRLTSDANRLSEHPEPQSESQGLRTDPAALQGLGLDSLRAGSGSGGSAVIGVGPAVGGTATDDEPR